MIVKRVHTTLSYSLSLLLPSFLAAACAHAPERPAAEGVRGSDSTTQLPAGDIQNVYYSDADFTRIVGRQIRSCVASPIILTGRRTDYYYQFNTSCTFPHTTPSTTYRCLDGFCQEINF